MAAPHFLAQTINADEGLFSANPPSTGYWMQLAGHTATGIPPYSVMGYLFLVHEKIGLRLTRRADDESTFRSH
ncbi:MAG: hypothetical protein ACRYFU_07760 [Janthinobacterium lividum]